MHPRRASPSGEGWGRAVVVRTELRRPERAGGDWSRASASRCIYGPMMRRPHACARRSGGSKRAVRARVVRDCGGRILEMSAAAALHEARRGWQSILAASASLYSGCGARSYRGAARTLAVLRHPHRCRGCGVRIGARFAARGVIRSSSMRSYQRASFPRKSWARQLLVRFNTSGDVHKNWEPYFLIVGQSNYSNQWKYG